jgi:hypothetical protein
VQGRITRGRRNVDGFAKHVADLTVHDTNARDCNEAKLVGRMPTAP